MNPIFLQAFSLYSGSLLIGLTLVSFPASSDVLKQLHGWTDQQYGAIFLPQLALAITGALLAGLAVNRYRLKTIYLLTLILLALSQMALCLSAYLPSAYSLYIVMFATAAFGFGFGFGGGPLNGLVSLLFPNRASTAITVLHTMAGLGLTIGPLFFNFMTTELQWIVAPGVLLIFVIIVFITTLFLRLPQPVRKDESEPTELPYKAMAFWLFMLLVVCYALSEGAFANWAVIYITEAKGLTATTAAIALSLFWGGLTLGRLVISFLLLSIRPDTILKVLPILMIGALAYFPSVSTATESVLAFLFAGIACSGFVPLVFAMANERYPYALSWIASMLTAALMFGVGLGSYLIGAIRGVISIEQIYYFSISFPVIVIFLLARLRRID